MTAAKDLLLALDLGSSVAEHDAALERYFIETPTFRRLIEDGGDVIAGDKGTGKTALYRILRERYRTFPELGGVEVVPAFNPSGAPVFQRLTESAALTEASYIGIWKAYLLSLVGNWILLLADGDYSEDMLRLDSLLTRIGLRSNDDQPQTIFSQLANKVRHLLKLSSVETTATVDPATGVPILGARLLFDAEDELEPLTRHDDALRLVDKILDEWDIQAWVILDRLDEAFQSFPAIERPALRALFRTYLDMLEFDRLRIKLFVRRDLFGRITSGGFVNLTHINARRIDITWDEEDLADLLYRRIVENERFMELLALQDADREQIFGAMFPDQVDPGARKAKTWKWMMSRIRDGNDVRPPRNLIDLVLKAQEAQLRREERAPREHSADQPLIEGDSLKRGLEALSSERVEDTLLAEAGELAEDIERFRNGKAEHNRDSLHDLLGEDVDEKEKTLRMLGFLEPVGSNFKVPILYRSGLSITQGKAFASDQPDADGDEEE